ncbi:MAG TPA: IS110 family transposase [Verrucomicrobiae bacterium]|nr:IS110 family transposase [Verrucomicrobiae bacterium]
MYLGFDISKAHADYALITRAGKKVLFGRRPNNTLAIAKVLDLVRADHPHVQVIVESTGIYQQYVLAACQQRSVPCRLLNPIQTKQFTRATIRKAKTDTKDAYHIALLGLQGAGYLTHPADEALAKARVYLRLASRLRDTATKLELMRQYMEESLATLDTKQLNESRQHLIGTLTHYRAQAAKLLEHIPSVQLIQSIPGIGAILSMGIVAEIGDLNRFDSAKQLVAYAGLDPKIMQSGPSQRTGKLTKRGSPFLRRDLYMASTVAQRFDPELKAAFQHQRDRGKSYTVATVSTARKLTHRIYAVLKRQTPYVATQQRE